MVLTLVENDALYFAVEMQRAALNPMRSLLRTQQRWFENNASNPWSKTPVGRAWSASCELLERLTRQYPKPEFNIRLTHVEQEMVHIRQHVVVSKPFCNLVHFEKMHHTIQMPPLLIVAPMSGHYATLLRGTVDALLPHFDVYITDWVNASYVPTYHGAFDLDHHIDYCMEFMEYIGSTGHVMAVCQPTVPVLAAISLMHSRASPLVPRSMILIGGPVDARSAPTKVNKFASLQNMQWFETQMITRVPFNYPGYMRQVYPGFIQLAGFMAMNLQRHIGEHVKLFQHLVEGDGESVDSHEKFYDEYLAVSDIPAEFYLQTVQTVFKDFALPTGTMKSRGENVDPTAISKTGLLVIEGELDDISGIGQTKAALDLCTNIPKDKKKYLLQKGVGHYGVFNGRKFRESIVPAIVEFPHKHPLLH